MALSIRLQQSKFKEKNRGGKWHARVVSNGVTSTNDLAESIQENTTLHARRGDRHHHGLGR